MRALAALAEDPGLVSNTFTRLSVTPAPGGSTHSLASMGSASMWYTYRQQTHIHACVRVYTYTHTQFKMVFKGLIKNHLESKRSVSLLPVCFPAAVTAP